MAVARKLFRLFKSFNEWIKIKEFLAGDLNKIDKYLSVATRLAFLLYWIFDNLSVLIKIKFIQGLDLASATKRACAFWLIGLVLGLIHAIRNLMQAAKEHTALLAQKSRDGMDEAKFKEALAKIRAKRITNQLNLIKNVGDSVTASQGLGYPKKFLGFDFNDGLCGIGGFTSAFLTCYQTYPAK
jgi:hypothetical protein